MNSNFLIFESGKDFSEDLASRLYRLDSNFFKYFWNFEAWKNLFSKPMFLIVLRNNQNEEIGFILFETDYGDSFSHLLKILIHPDYRNMGFAKILLDESIKKFLELGISKIYLEVEKTNIRAIEIYKSSGFKVIHEKKSFYSDGADALILLNESLH